MMKHFFKFVTILLISRAIQAQIDDYESTETHSIQAQQLPLTIKQHPQSQIAIKGNRVTFKCDFEAAASSNDPDTHIQSTKTQTIDYSLIKVSWLHDSRLVEATSSNEPSSPLMATLNVNQYVIDHNSLVILAYEPHKHNGQYRCMLNNTMFSPPLILLSEPASLSTATINEFQVDASESLTSLEMSEGNVAIISCKLPQSNPPAVPIFYLNDNLLATEMMGVKENAFNNRYKVFQSGNLQIANVRHKDTGVYKCGARNSVTNEIKVSPKRVHLKVYEPFGTKLPDIILTPQDTNRVRVGGNLTLECVANGAPVPLVSWEKFGGTLPEKRSIQIYGNLILTNIQLEDKGTYVCRAENGPGQATFKTAMVDVFESPTTSSADTTYTAKNGQTVQLKCPIKSRPRADTQWFYQGRLLASNQMQRIQTVGDMSILTLKKFHSSTSTGIYQCYAQNEYGFKQVNLLLIPFESKSGNSVGAENTPKRPVIIMGPQNTTIYEGQSVVLLCVTGESSSSSTQINWLQNDLIIEPTLMRRFEINQLLGNLRIVSIQKSDAGVYKCIASNEYGMSTAEAFVQVKSTENEVTTKKDDDIIVKQLAQASRPTIQQIGHDKILLKWHLTNENNNNNIGYFKVEYKTNKQQQQLPGIQPNTWLTIDEQIDSKKREYILTDLSKLETYRFRITTFFLNGELNHSHQSTRFKLESTWTDLMLTTAKMVENVEIKLSQIQVQITQIWAIAASSLGLKWNAFLLEQQDASLNSVHLILSKINGFYVYYRKLNSSQSNNQQVNVPLYNYTRLNLPISGTNQKLIETHMIANLEPESTYEIKMTCYNLKGDLCSFSNAVTGLTLSVNSTPQPTSEVISLNGINLTPSTNNLNNIEQAVLLKTKQNEILFMVLGIVLGILILLLIIFVLMCLMRHRQHKRLLAQLQNTSQKLASSSCPTLIYEDSLRHQAATNHHSQTQQRLNLHHYNQNSLGGNDSNSTNSQSMSTTTSSMTTPPAMNSAQTNSDINNSQQMSHVLLLNGNTISTSSIPPAPPIPNAPPPQIFPNTNTSTLNRMNINLNPLNSFLENATNSNRFNPLMSPSKPNQGQENFYHTLTTLGNLPSSASSQINNDFSNEAAAAMYADYNNATLSIRAQIMLKQQQQQQQHIQLMNTLLKQQQHFNNMNTLEKNKSSSSSKSAKSPSSSSMRRKNLLNSSKKSKKSFKKHDSNLSDKHVNSSNSLNANANLDENTLLQQQPKNYYLLPNIRTQPNNIYNDVNFLTIEAALNQNNIPIFNNINNNNGLGNFYLLNQQQTSHLLQQHPVYNSSISTFSPNHLIQQQPPLLMSPSKIVNQQTVQNNNDSAMLVNIFETKNNQIPETNLASANKDSSIYESSDMDASEQDPMLVNKISTHYASSGLLLTKGASINKKQYSDKVNHLDEQRQLI